MAKKSSSGIQLRQISHPVIYEVNTRILLRELSASEGGKVTLGTIPDRVIDEWAGYGFHAVWMMGAWDSGPQGVAIAREHKGLRKVYQEVLPGYTDDDVIGSPYAVHAYKVPVSYGGEKGLKTLRARLAQREIGLILDYIPNHTARDHAWVEEHPEYYIRGEEGEEKSKPDIYFRTGTVHGDMTLAFGRDPAYAGWTDTAQLNPLHPGARAAMTDTLQRIAGMCDGVRCDMAMLVMSGVFERTWGERSRPVEVVPAVGEFWKDAIDAGKKANPFFIFIAEAYWNLEWDLQQLGFDYTYDKTLYDRLLHEGAGSVRDHLRAESDFQRRSLRFIENHDELRAARAMPSELWQYAAACITATIPGMVLFHDGQFEGRMVKLPVQLARRPEENVVQRTKSFYKRLLLVINSSVFQNGSWRLLMPRAAWQDNHTWHNFLTYCWQEKSVGIRLVVINYAPHSGQGYVDVPLEEIEGNLVEFRDLLGGAAYTRDKASIGSRGMYFDLPPYGVHIFEVSAGKRFNQ